ncbi:MAG: PUA domain-containing protein [Acidilobaceae archaeon]
MPEKRRPTLEEYNKIYYTLAYQFNLEVAKSLLYPQESIKVELSPKGKVKYVFRDNYRILTRRASDGLLTLSIEAARIIKSTVKPPRFRVIVKSTHVRDFKGSILKPSVIALDEALRAGDEVIIVDEYDRLIGIGKLKLPPLLVMSMDKGEVVRIRSLVGVKYESSHEGN